MEKRTLNFDQARRAFLAYLQRDPTAMKLAERVRARISKEASQKGVKFTPAYLKESVEFAEGVVDHVAEQLEKHGYAIGSKDRVLIANTLLFGFGDVGRSANPFGTSPSHVTQRSGRSTKPSEHQVARVRRRERD